MSTPRLVLLAFAVVLALGYFGLREVSTAANTVPSTRAGVQVLPVGASDLRPVECESMRLDTVIRGAGSINGTNKGDLILGSPAADDLRGGPGHDCLVGGGGDDTLDGGPGHDVCIGGPGDNTFKNCEVIHP
jgi:Ca2+-binding RTX toxin-like protein